MSKERYHQNRRRVAEIYGLTDDDGNVANGVSCHHIIERSDSKKKNSPFFGRDVDDKGNLYPFTSQDEHQALHDKLGDNHEPRKKRR